MYDFFTADLHWGHKNIIKFCNRPWPSVELHDKKLKENWNDTVGAKSKVAILGDWSFWNIEKIAQWNKGLNGEKHLILGNHDNFKWSDYIRAGFASVQRYQFIEFPGIGAVGLAHDPSNCIVDMSCPWICGHLHQQFEKMNNCVNTGVDVRNFKPVNKAEMFELLRVTKRFHMNLDENAKKEFGATYGLGNH